MCGIAGIWSPGRDPALLSDAARRMGAQLVHRGPDAGGEALVTLPSGARVALAHRRLRVVDRSERGAQPMRSHYSPCVLAYNGEVYNFRQLRAELSDYAFESDCDTEVMLHAYEAWGLEAFERFRGMWACALVDPQHDRLLLSRDRFGVKPLYYAWHEGELLFASEIKAILAAASSFERRMTDGALLEYFGYRQPLEDRSWFRGIARLPPGHHLIVDGSGPRVVRYWQLPVPETHPDPGADLAREQVRAAFGEAVELRLIADVPVGAYLSGGLDSSAVVYEMQARARKVATFSVTFEQDADVDESGYARSVAAALGTDHRELALLPGAYFDTLPAVIEKKDAPLAVPNEVALYQLSRELKRHITVVLSGEGADELFGGYGRIFRSADDLAKLPQLTATYPDPPRDLIDLFLRHYSYLGERDTRALLLGPARELPRDALLRREAFERYFAGTEPLAPAERFMHVFQRAHLAGLLDRLDTATMAFGVEARVPFVDHLLVQRVQRLPLAYKLRFRSREAEHAASTLPGTAVSERYDEPKYILREAYRPYLPRAILDREKLGFPIPLGRWLSTPAGARACEPLWAADARSRELFDRAVLRAWCQPGAAGSHALAVWMCLNVELWMRHYDVRA